MTFRHATAHTVSPAVWFNLFLLVLFGSLPQFIKALYGDWVKGNVLGFRFSKSLIGNLGFDFCHSMSDHLFLKRLKMAEKSKSNGQVKSLKENTSVSHSAVFLSFSPLFL